MKHYCIFEIKGNRSKFVMDFKSYTEGEEMLTSMRNFKTNKEIIFILRCLEEEEFTNIKKYNPFLNTIIIK